MAFEESAFQTECRTRCTEWCLIQGGEVKFARVGGAHEGFLVGRVTGLPVACEIYIYESEAGLMLPGNDWHPCPRSKHPSDQAVMGALVELLGQHLRKPAAQDK